MTLFQLCCDTSHLTQTMHKLTQMWQADDAIILLNNHIAFIQWLAEEWLPNHTNLANIDGQVSKPTLNIPLAVYALQTDINQLNSIAKSSLMPFITQANSNLRLNLLTDAEWVTMTQTADKVITLT